MSSVYIIPEWFFSYTILLQLIFTLITAFVGLYALKIYKLSDQRQSKIFGYGFILISISYLIQAVLTFVAYLKIHISNYISISSFNNLSSLGTYFHILFFLAGLVTIAYMTLGIKSRRTYFFMCMLLLLPLILTPFKVETFHILSLFLLAYIVWHYLVHLIKSKNLKNISVLIAFSLLFITNIDLIFALNNGAYYIISDLIALVAFLIILVNLIRIVRK